MNQSSGLENKRVVLDFRLSAPKVHRSFSYRVSVLSLSLHLNGDAGNSHIKCVVSVFADIRAAYSL